ncbi:MAG: hypothetical protein JXR96_29385 [Deltaproteobacteria bacterium]|nr:hypothetical protein [Deltaproteobacteria bacterium]
MSSGLFGLDGLQPAPAQVWGAVRLMPLVQTRPIDDLRIDPLAFGEAFGLVGLDSRDPLLASQRPEDWPETVYASYIPHAYVISFGKRQAEAVWGGRLKKSGGKKLDLGPFKVRLLHRMMKKDCRDRWRILPLHLAMEGFLALHFAGPAIAWQEYSRQALTYGLSPRIEGSISGRAIRGLEDALRVFEIHAGQVGMAVFVADALAAMMVVSHPDDYRRLHRSLVEDFFCDLMLHYGLYSQVPEDLCPRMRTEGIRSLADLQSAFSSMRQGWHDAFSLLAEGLLERTLSMETVNKAGPHRLLRFVTRLDPARENHIGESIVREDGRVEYLKTYRLSAAQTRRAHLLQVLAEHGWHLEDAAGALNETRRSLTRRMENAGFGYLLKENVRAAARSRRRK